ncbi:MAG: hypothetical protein HY897_10885 [Deltaproteobacteria bacterium]|nr:hypothetical protein [Deltaproteobacteria bacterium]
MREPSEGGVDPAVVFFLGRNLGHEAVATALRGQGVQIERHADHFADDAPDQEWLVDVGQRGWAVVTQDDRIRYRRAERAAMCAANVRLFVFTGKQMRGPEIGASLAKALNKMARFAGRHGPPFIARVSRNGEVTLWKSAEDLAAEAARSAG